MSTYKTPPKDHVESLFVYEYLTPTQKRIVRYLLWYHEKRLIGSPMEIFPCIDTIAKKCSCSEKTVDRFIKQYEGILFVHRKRKSMSRKGWFTSNLYQLNKFFFTFLSDMQRKNLLHLWDKPFHVLDKKKREMRVKVFAEIHNAVSSIEKALLSTSQCPTITPQKCPYTKLLDLTKLSVNIRTQSVSNSVKKQEDILQKVPIPNFEKRKLTKFFPHYACRQAAEDYVWFSKQNSVYNPAGFMWKRAKMHNLNRITR